MAHGPSPVRLSWRIGVTMYESSDEFARLEAFLSDYMPIVDEVAFFETITHHLYVPLDELAGRAEVLSRRMKALKDIGVESVGINVLTTIGHVNEAWDWMEPLPFQPMIGHDGAVSTGCACPNTPDMRAYVREKYRLFAGARPDFIWVDDDIRMNHHGVAYACFCPTCLDILSKSTGRAWTREALVAALNSPDGGAARQAWIEQNAASIESLLADVRAAIDGVDPRIIKGLMPVGPSWSGYSGTAWQRWFKALGAAKCRPGGGFYSDERPKAMLAKALECGRVRAVMPPEAPDVSDVQYELENFPYGVMDKSASIVINECTLALAAGLNGIAFNALGGSAGLALDDHRPLMEEIKSARYYWEVYASHVAGLPTAGLWPAWNADLWARRSVAAGEDWFAPGPEFDQRRPYILADIGIPLAAGAPAFGRESAVVLPGRVAEAFTDGELEAILSGGVLMDSVALQVLEGRGLAPLAGVKVSRRMDNGLWERLTDDPLCGLQPNEVRDARVEFWGDARGQADELAPTADGVRILSRMEDYRGGVHGPAMTAFENELGGRVVVMGYAPWMFIGSAAKRSQLQEVADWITRGRLAVRVEEPVRLVPFARMSADGSRGAVMLINAGFDRVRTVTVHVRAAEGAHAAARLIRSNGRPRPLSARPAAIGFTVKLLDIEPWTTVAILFG